MIDKNNIFLSHVIKRENNNFDCVRLIAACLVIYGHANALILPGVPEGGDFVKSLLGFDNSGMLAVKIFFFLSGLVVANSLLEKGLALQFLLSRFFRIWPGMMFVVLVTTLILGPALTRLDMKDYWSHASVMDYVTGNFLMDIRFDLPGVFDNLS